MMRIAGKKNVYFLRRILTSKITLPIRNQ